MADYGECWCCARYGLATAAVSTIGLCRPCGGRGPMACEKAHEKQMTPEAWDALQEKRAGAWS
jgi:hypothetical protein